MNPMKLLDSYPGESVMLEAIEEAVSWNREACRTQDQRNVCWLYRSEIYRQQARAVA